MFLLHYVIFHVPACPNNSLVVRTKQPVQLVIPLFSWWTRAKKNHLLIYSFLLLLVVFSSNTFLFSSTCTGCFRKMVLYPKGKGLGKGTHLSLYLALDLATLPAGCRVYADYTLSIVDQVNGRQNDRYAKGKNTGDLLAGLTCQWKREREKKEKKREGWDCFFFLQLKAGLVPQAQKMDGQDIFPWVFISLTLTWLSRTFA